MANSSVVTRFAPSPTGFLHIGGARTALFNLLFARRHGGKYLLRIEDTDRARSTPEAIDAIVDGLSWMDLAGDEPAVSQFARAGRHGEVAHSLLDAGRAYRCYATPEELTALREEQRAAGAPQRYDGRWRDRAPGPDEVGRPFVVRLKAPTEGATAIADLVQGEVTVQNAELDDMVLLRSDGTPTYMLAVVVDDHDMGVTHVIRGDDHLNNAFRQLALIRALEWPEPAYAHVPMIHGPDGAKLSKRHGALGVDAYRDEMGILPEALENYLLRLGWGHGDTELITRAEAERIFDLSDVGRSPARFDLQKLLSVNAHYMRAAAPERLAAQVAPALESHAGRAVSAAEHAALVALMPELTQRAKDIHALALAARAVLPPNSYDEKATALLRDGQEVLAATEASLAGADFTREGLEGALNALAAERGVKFNAIGGPLRAALTGTTASPSLFALMSAIGRAETLGRVRAALQHEH